MTISFQGSSGSLFNALGRIGKAIGQVRTYQLAQQSNLIGNNGIYPQLDNSPDIQALIGSSWINSLNGPESVCATLVQVAQVYMDRLVFNDNPQPNQSLQSTNIPASIAEVIRQMKAEGVTILQMTVTAAPTGAFTNVYYSVGNEVIVTSVKRASDGAVVENAFPETLQVTCTGDSVLNGATAYNEPFSVTGEASQGDVFAYNWPAGSGASISINAIDGDTSSGAGNFLVNSGFATFTSNVPDSWTLQVGTAGTNVFEETGLIYSGPAALRITGDNSNTLTALAQQFNSSVNANELTPLTQYSHNIFLRRGGTVPTQGVLQVALVDSGGTVIADQNGVANSYTIDLTQLTTAYVASNGVFRTPALLPSSIFLRLALTTSLPNGVSIYLGKGSLGLMSQLYTSGPSVAIHSGNQIARISDYTSILVSNSFGAGGSLSTFQVLLNQILSNQPNDVLFPSALAPTISDTLITS